VELVPGHINQYKSVFKEEKKYRPAILISIFFIIAMLTVTYFIFANSEPSKLLLETDHFNILHHGEEVKTIYDNGEEVKTTYDSSD
jgi:hypothetical protein